MNKNIVNQSIIKPIKSVVWGIVDLIAKILVKTKILDSYVLVRPDGGLCSQMHFYMVGNHFEKQGHRVKYTMDWFEKNGYDMNHEYVYNFDLLKAFPSIKINTASKLETVLYHAFIFRNDYYDNSSLYDWLGKKPPIYLNGYYNTPKEWYYTFKQSFSPDYSVLDDSNLAMLNEIQESNNSVAIHVRLGDLQTFHSAYGEPASVAYFKKAISYVEERKGKCMYFFFSVDPQWVRDNLIPYLGLDDNYRIVDINGSDKGYMDLLLISACESQITSKGSLGKYAGFLHEGDNIITVVDDEYERLVWDGSDQRIVFIKV